MSGRPDAARLLLRAAALLVPRSGRRAWLEEWTAELAALERYRTDGGGSGLPGPFRFATGALPHALWTRKEEWTMNGVGQDLRYALRVLVRTPGFTAVAVVTLALGIGANATIFSLVNGLLLRTPPAVEAPDRLVQIARSYDDDPRWDNWSWPALRTLRDEGRVFDGVAGYTGRSATVGAGADAEQASVEMVTGNYFGVLGVRPAVGRLLGPDDDRAPGAHPVAVLGFDLWQRRFGADPAAVGRTVLVAGQPYEVVGVAPAGFSGVEALGPAPDLFVPAMMAPGFRGELPFEAWGWSWIQAIGRLAEGVDYAEAVAAMDVVTDRLRRASDTNADIRVLLAEGIGMAPEERAEAETMSLLLTAVALLVLLLTCANVANLFIARATTRQGEMGVRLALGAGRGRLARQLVTESVVLGLGAAAVAFVPLSLGARALPSVLPYTVSVSLAPDGRVLAMLVVLGVVSGVLFGAVPAVVAARRDLIGTLRASGTTGATRRSGIRNGLVVLQIALSLGLLTGATLLGSSVRNAAAADPGFEPRGLLAVYVDLEGTGRYDRAQATAFGEALAREAASLPGVVSATVASRAPFLGGYTRSSRVPADRADDENASVEAEAVFVTGGYVETLGIPLLEGRTLEDPAREPEPVALVNEALARRFWPGESAVGKELAGGDGGPIRVVGVVADVQHRGLRAAPVPAVYQPLSESFTQRIALLVRTTGDPLAVGPAARELVAGLDPGLPVLATADVHGRMAASLGATRTLGTLVGAFAGLALVLAVVGLYGLVSFAVAQRVREMGIRLALGAGPDGLTRLVLRQAMALTGVGALAGVALALGVGRSLEGALFGVEASDPRALASATALLVAAAALAAWLPARRASRVDAMVSLRE
ncbi:MAG: ABC transporter permease [Longimicrobiales bacterium]